MLPTDATVMAEPLRRSLDGGEVRGYRVESFLARGPLTMVYVASRGGTRYALKAIPLDGPGRAVAEAVLLDAERLKKLRHEHLATVYEVFSYGPATWIVEDLVPGRPADQFADGILGWETTVQIGLRAAKALAYAWRFHHAAHGDLKPSNLVLEVAGGVLSGMRVTDLGLARPGELSASEVVLGAPLFRAPEVPLAPSDAVSDQYSLGAVLHFLLTGHPPATPEDGGAPRLDGHPPAVAALVERMLMHQPAERFAGWEEVIAACDGALAVNPFEAPATTRFERGEPRSGATPPSTARLKAGSAGSSTTSLRADAVGGWLRERVRETARHARTAPPAASLAPGGEIAGVYRITEVLHASTLVELYAVDEAILNRRLTLKLLTAAGMANPGVVDRLAAEGTLLGSLHHPSFPFVAGRGQWQGRAYLAAERVGGADLKTYLTHKGRFAEGQALWVAHELAAAMEHAHESCRLVHRDLKPAHLAVSDGSGGAPRRLKITDFSTALFLVPRDLADFSTGERMLNADSGAGLAVGTPAYMSPEQVRGEPLTPQADIYALGCTLFHLLTGETPFKAANAVAMMQAHLGEEPPDMNRLAEITASTVAVVQRCMAKHPRERFPSWKHLRLALQSASFASQSAQRRKDRGMTSTFTRPVSKPPGT